MESMRLLVELIEGTPHLSKQVKPRGISRSHGAEGIELTGDRRIRFRTRTKGGGRGFSGARLVFDEAMMFPASTHSALMFIVSAQSNRQLVYAGSSVDQEVHEDGSVLAGLRERGLAGDDPSLAYLEWSAGDDLEEAMTEDFQCDPENWARGNPALGIRITGEHVANEQRAMRANPRGFAVERLGVGDWPAIDEDAIETALPLDAYEACIDKTSQAVGPLAVAVDVKPDRSAAAIGVAGEREDGLIHAEVIDHRPRTGWVLGRLLQIVKDHDVTKVAIDKGGPAAALPLAAALEEVGVELVTLSGPEYAQACGALFDVVTEHGIRFAPAPELDAAVHGAARRKLGEAWAWGRSVSTGDISPLVAVTVAAATIPQTSSEPLVAWGR